jgi:peptidoglycan/LPS O-acetylase OafA/YrhL
VNQTYRPDIDGLRAVAVLAVVIFHAFPARLPGGFVGVDIFFVIYRYLITGGSTSEIQQYQFRVPLF